MEYVGAGHPGANRSYVQSGGSHNTQYNAEHIHLAAERAETPPPPCLHLPFRRDRDYVDRPALAAEIHAKLAQPAARVALVGLGGVGKSQLAIEHCYRVREQSPGTWVLWIHASNAARYEQSLREVAEVVKIRGRHDAKTEIFALVRAWLRDPKGSKRWLIVLDNVDDASFLLEPPVESSDAGRERRIDYLPACAHGSILVTSRSEDEARNIVQYAADVVKVRPMEMGDAVAVLERKLGDQHSRTDIARLAETLEGIPLALTQAASYILQRGRRYTVERYIQKLPRGHSSKNSVLDEEAEDHQRDREAKNAISITWQISFEHVYRTRRSAADLLSVMSLCDRQAIPDELIRACTKSSRVSRRTMHVDTNAGAKMDVDGVINGKVEAEYESDGGSEQSLDDAFDKDLTTLEGYSFVSITTDKSAFEMHRLVQQATQGWLNVRGLLEDCIEWFVGGLDDVFPAVTYDNWSACQKFFPHARAALQQRPKVEQTVLQWTNILYKAGWYASEQGNAADAERMSTRSMKERQKILGAEHPSTLTSVSNLARVLQDQGKYEATEEMNRRALEGREKVLGAEHPSTLTSVSNLALVLRYQGKYDAAEEMNRRALEGREKVLGAEHPSTLTSVSNLALVLRYQGKYDAAEEMNRRVLEASEKVLGAEHPDTLISVSNLALVLQDQGKYEATEEMNRRALEGYEKVLGAEHPSTLTSVSNLASVLQDQGKYEAAEEMNRRALEGREKVLGAEHPETLTSVSILASGLRDQGKYEAAEEMNRRALEGREKVLGAEHPDTLTSVYCLAYLFHQKHYFAAALPLYERACAGYSKTLGPAHPTTKACRAHMASLQDQIGEY